jgi:hypothetical protein
MNYKEIVSKTKDKFQSMSFIPGDTFSEMLSFWIVVISNQDGMIKTLEGNSDGLKLVTYESPENFHNKCSYKNIDGYCIEYYFYQEKMTIEEIRDFKLNELGV